VNFGVMLQRKNTRVTPILNLFWLFVVNCWWSYFRLLYFVLLVKQMTVSLGLFLCLTNILNHKFYIICEHSLVSRNVRCFKSLLSFKTEISTYDFRTYVPCENPVACKASDEPDLHCVILASDAETQKYFFHGDRSKCTNKCT